MSWFQLCCICWYLATRSTFFGPWPGRLLLVSPEAEERTPRLALLRGRLITLLAVGLVGRRRSSVLGSGGVKGHAMPSVGFRGK